MSNSNSKGGNYPVPVARVLLCDRRRRFLVGFRVDTGRWEFPGGKIEHLETPEEAAKRECQEECLIRPIGFSEFAGYTTVKHMTKDRSSLELYVAYSEWEGEAGCGERNHSEWRWMSLDELKCLPLMPSASKAAHHLIPEFMGSRKDWPPLPLINVSPCS